MVWIVVFSIVLAFFYMLIMNHYSRSWKAIKSFEDNAIFNERVSIIIAFRDEKANLPSLIGDLEKQSFPKDLFEVIFIDDHSSDGGNTYLKNVITNLNIKMINLEEDIFGKKMALKKGWESATGQVIVHTDADVRMGENWLQTLTHPFENTEIQLISGPVAFFDKKNFWHQLIQLEFAGLVAIGAAHIQWKRPLICNGANLAFRHTFLAEYDYENQRQFTGDDVFLMEHIHQKNPGSVFFQKNKEAMVTTHPPSDLKKFLWQRIRWSRKNHAYQDKKNVWILLLVWLFHLLILINFFSFQSIGMLVFWWLLIVKILVDHYFFEEIKDFFSIKYHIKYSIFGVIFHTLYITFVPLIAKFVKVSWKQRKWK